MKDKLIQESNYLWDRSGEPDAEIQQLETVLGRLRHRPLSDSAPDWPAQLSRSNGWRGWLARLNFPRLAPVLAAAALIAIGAMLIEWPILPEPTGLQEAIDVRETIGLREAAGPRWEVSRMAGAPRIGSDRIGATAQLAVGQSLETDSNSRARIAVGKIGQVDVEPGTRLRLVEARVTENRLALERGTIHAFISAPPRLFFVDTPSAVAVDLGCAYTLQVDDRGVSLLRVTFGWVEFETHGQQTLIPAGAAAITKPGIGPGTAYFEDASEIFKAALERLDFERLPALDRARTLHTLLAEARPRDGFTLLNLLRQYRGVQESERGLIYDRLAELIPPPPGVVREQLVRGNDFMVGLWWDLTGVGHPGKK